MRLNFGMYLRGKCASYQKQEARKRSVLTELQKPSPSDDLPSRGQLVNQAAEHEFGVKGRTRERKETHTEKDHYA